MNTILLITTVFSLAVAAASVIVLFVAYREQRRRSEARVDALRLLADDAAFDDMPLTVEPAPATHDLDTVEAGDAVADVEIDAAPARPMFGDTRASSPWGRRLAAAAVVAIVAAVAGYVLIPRSGRATAATVASTEKAGPTQSAPLELLSLRHTQQDGRLVITGLVQNPRSGVPMNRVVATAFLFDAAGTLLASGRAPLDFSTLAAGDESPFVLTVPVDGAVSRYRVGFRSEDGRVIGHVDRRAAGTLARTGE
jgi:hypothetical protein